MKTLFSLLFVLLLSGCLPQSKAPPYLVLITAENGLVRCSGVIISRIHVLTNEHCSASAKYVTSQINQVATVAYVSYASKEDDLAVLLLAEQIYSSHYAEFAQVDTDAPVALYAHCLRYWPHIPRPGYFVDTYEEMDVWLLDGCSGDSGGPLIQNGKVVGLIRKVLPDTFSSFSFYDGEVSFSVQFETIDRFLKGVTTCEMC